MDPLKAYEIIGGELAAFSDAMLEKPMIVVATKLDATTDQTKLRELKKFCAKKNLEFHAISAPTGEGVKELVRAMADALDKIPKEQFDEEDTEAAEEESDSESSAELGDEEQSDGTPSEG